MTVAERQAVASAGMAEFLPQLENVALEGAAPSTISRYSAPWRRWEEFAAAVRQTKVPASPKFVALFLLKEGKDARSYAKIKGATSALSFYHKLHGHPSPSGSVLVRMTKESLRRRFSSSIHRAEMAQRGFVGQKHVLTFTQLDEICVKFGGDADVRFRQATTIMMASVAGFFRSAEVLALLIGDVVDLGLQQVNGCQGQRRAIMVFVESSKGDQYRDGVWVPMLADSRSSRFAGRGLSGGAWLLLHWIQVERAGGSRDEPVFCVAAPGCERVRSERPRPWSYSSYLEWVKKLVVAVGLDADCYATHSVGRATGATRAAAAGVPDRLFKKHGRWASDKSKDLYVRESFREVLEVSARLEDGD
jgi:hypothetical protein